MVKLYTPLFNSLPSFLFFFFSSSIYIVCLSIPLVHIHSIQSLAISTIYYNYNVCSYRDQGE